MGRVPHQKSAKQSGHSNAVRGSKTAKQRKNHKVVIESDSQDKEKSRAVLSFRAEPPPGYTFIPAGNPQLTAALKESAKRGNHQILAVTTTPHASRHELSREVHRIGFHFPTEVVAQVCSHYGIRLTSGGKLVEEKDDDKLFMRLYQKGQLVLDEKVRDQVTINTEAKQIIQDLFPNIPDNDLFQIIKTAFQLGDGKVGTADEIPLVRRAQLSVVAHIRHTYTNYDKLLRQVPYSEARHKVESITLQKLIDWRGDGKDDKHAMDDTLREVVVISDEEDSDEVEEGQLLENSDLRVRPVNGAIRPKNIVDGRPRSPIEIQSDDEAPRGYRYLPQVVKRYPLQDVNAVHVARQQSRYAVWDRVRQEYRNAAIPQPPRIIERIPLDESSTTTSQALYPTRETLYAPDPVTHRVLEPTARVIPQAAPPTYIRGADGKLYERITTHTQQVAAPTPPRRVYTPSRTDNGHQYLDSRPASPRPNHPHTYRRTESFEHNDSMIMPSIEGPNDVYASPTNRRNPFYDSRSNVGYQNSGVYESNQRHIIDLTSSAEQASKRRRLEETPPSPHVAQHLDHTQNGYGRSGARVDAHQQNIDNAYRSQQYTTYSSGRPAIEHNSSRVYERAEHRLQPAIVYREEFPGREMPSPRLAGTRPMPPAFGATDAQYVQSPRRLEYFNDHDRRDGRVLGEPTRLYGSGHEPNSDNDHHTHIVLEDSSRYVQSAGYRAEPAPRYTRPEGRNAFEAPVHPQYYAQDLPQGTIPREYGPSITHQYPPSRDVRPVQIQAGDGTYYQQRMIPPPPTTYRDGQNLRTAYVQN